MKTTVVALALAVALFVQSTEAAPPPMKLRVERAKISTRVEITDAVDCAAKLKCTDKTGIDECLMTIKDKLVELKIESIDRENGLAEGTPTKDVFELTALLRKVDTFVKAC